MSSDADGHSTEVARPTDPHAAEGGDPFPNPGIPPHEPRITDVDERAAKRAERQVAAMFTLASLLIVAFVVCYIVIPKDAAIFSLGAQNVALGGTLGLALLLLGIGAIQWSRRLMEDREIVEERHDSGSTPEQRAAAIDIVWEGGRESKIGQRTLIRRSLIGALGLLGIPPILLLADLGPLPGDKLAHTIWRRRTRIVNDITLEPLRPEDMVLGQLVNALPESLEKLHGEEYRNAKAKAAVILIRMHPDEIRAIPKRKEWRVDGILCYSKICTHVGCPVNLYERETHHMLCPCHQSTFDLADNGKVVFGPAARSLPQLPIMVDSDGFLVAQRDFEEPIGPSYWERERQI